MNHTNDCPARMNNDQGTYFPCTCCLSSREKIESLRAQLEAANESAAQFSRNADFYRDLICQIGDMYEDEARTSDDGSLQDDVLALKVPELVAASLTKIANLTARLEGGGEPVAEVYNAGAGRVLWLSLNQPPQGTKLYTAPPIARLEGGGELIGYFGSDRLTGMPMYLCKDRKSADFLIEAGKKVFPLYTAPPTISAAVAAGQAREMKLRKAVLSVLCDPEGRPCFVGSDGDREVIAEAIALPSDTTALREMLSEAVVSGFNKPRGYSGIEERNLLVAELVAEIIGG